MKENNLVKHTTGAAAKNAELLFRTLNSKQLLYIAGLLNNDPTNPPPGIFRPCVLLYLILSSESHALARFLKDYKHWRKSQSKKANERLVIHAKWLDRYQIGCNCDGCYRECLNLAVSYKVILQ